MISKQVDSFESFGATGSPHSRRHNRHEAVQAEAGPLTWGPDPNAAEGGAPTGSASRLHRLRSAVADAVCGGGRP